MRTHTCCKQAVDLCAVQVPSQAAPMELFSFTLGRAASLTACMQLLPCRQLPATTQEHAPFQEHAPERGPWIVWRV